ncbi:MAG TPA: dihydroneopterin aldolase [Cyclobacteriaceae bacterium]|nr:dihydroneopterin aldolase [Cyclobacteriaceae bacterium]
MGKVALYGLEFHAYHGVYLHERTSGNKFQVDIIVETDFDDAAYEDELSGTINYEDLYKIVKEEMEKPSRLLETVGHLITIRVLENFSSAREVNVEIAKFNPPIGGVCKKASVTINKKR